MDAVFFAIVLGAFLVGGYHQWSWVPSAADSVSPMTALGTAMVDAAGGACLPGGAGGSSRDGRHDSQSLRQRPRPR